MVRLYGTKVLITMAQTLMGMMHRISGPIKYNIGRVVEEDNIHGNCDDRDSNRHKRYVRMERS